MENVVHSASGISVIIPTYNACKTIKRCIQSVIDTGYTPLEIIIADDASTDDTSLVVESIIKTKPNKVLLVQLGKNGGPARARNFGAEKATYDYLFFLDSDTEMLPDALCKFYKRISDADAVCGHYHWKPLNNTPVAWYKSMLNYHMFSKLGVFEHDVFLGSAAGIRRAAFEKTKGFNSNLKWGMDYENEEFGHRLSKDHKILLDPSITVYHDFPNFISLTKTYFIRVSQWVKLFAKRRKFEAGGPASKSVGFASMAFPAFLFSLVYTLINSWWLLPTMLFAMVYLNGYLGFLGFVLRKKPLFLPIALFLNGYFCIVVSTGAVSGLLSFFFGENNDPS